jgi:hypothetical protein
MGPIGSPPETLGESSCAENAQGEDTGEDRVHAQSNGREAVEEQERLDQERRVPEDFNENGGGMPQERPLGQPRKRDTRPDEQRYRYRRETEQHRVEQTSEKQRQPECDDGNVNRHSRLYANNRREFCR